ncbi:MAG: hypothetical protein IPP72_11025 [Chitinophagaceae bacterium]|nr:hypothetical protein [Chitinophagaceae bacterium]
MLAVSLSMQSVYAQLTTTPVCPVFTVDVLEGTINEKLDCRSTAGEVKKVFPCFTDVVEETGGAGCGGVFYKDKGISFFTERNYIEINEKFKGKLIPALLGTNRTGLFKLLGNPKIKDPAWDAFTTKFGILILYYDKAGNINKLQLSNKSTDSIKLCE